MNKSCARCSKVVYPLEELKCLEKVSFKSLRFFCSGSDSGGLWGPDHHSISWPDAQSIHTHNKSATILLLSLALWVIYLLETVNSLPPPDDEYDDDDVDDQSDRSGFDCVCCLCTILSIKGSKFAQSSQILINFSCFPVLAQNMLQVLRVLYGAQHEDLQRIQ